MEQITDLITIDREANAAYMQLSREVSVSTEVLNDFVNVDLDSSHQVVGVELLSLDEEVPFEDLASRYHLRADLIESLKELWFAKS